MVGIFARLGRGLRIIFAVFTGSVICFSVSATAGQSIPVPKATIYPGDLIGDDLLTMRRFNTRGRAGRRARDARTIYASREFLIGKVARRTLLRGRPIPRNAVREPDVVSRGKSVLVSYRSGRLLITAYATALQSGRAGDIVSLRNIDSGTVISGRVLKDGTVQLSGVR